MAAPELTEPVKGLFALISDYEDRAIPKDAGFRWHPADHCGRRGCPACKGKLGRVWWTDDILKALEVTEYAPAELRASIEDRSGPAADARRAVRLEAERIAEIRNAARRVTLAASQAHDADIDVPCPEGRSYLPYQRAAIAFGLSRENVLFADEMGLGKTVEALGVINADEGAARVLIVCPASLKLNWARECERWLVDRGPIGIAGKEFPFDANVVVINYDILGKWKDELSHEWDILVADECHYVKNKDAKRSKNLFAIEAKRRLFLTGTPILNRPAELWPIVSSLAPDTFDDFWKFARRHCSPRKNRFGWEFNGATRLDELHEDLRGSIMVRRTKAEVLPDLPPKRRQIIELASDHIADLIEVEASAWREHQDRLNELRAASRETGREPTKAEMTAMREGLNLAFSELAKLRQSTAIAKAPLVVEHVQSVLENVDKVVLFAHHRAVVNALAEPFGDAAVTLKGDDGAEARQAAVDRFQEAPRCRLFVGSITAAGFGLTLTASLHVVFAELDWVPAHMTQAEDRTHRIGQKNSVLVQHLVLQDSLDARMVRTFIKKQRVIDQITDGDVQGDLFDGDIAEAIMAAAEENRPDGDQGSRPSS